MIIKNKLGCIADFTKRCGFDKDAAYYLVFNTAAAAALAYLVYAADKPAQQKTPPDESVTWMEESTPGTTHACPALIPDQPLCSYH